MKDKHGAFMAVAEVFAMQGTCPRLRVGAVAIKDNRIIATGYNGAPRGTPHCGCILDKANHCINAVHAEANIIANAAFTGAKLDGCVIYCTHEPCERCSALLINAGIVKVYFKTSYRSTEEVPMHKKQLITIKI